MGELQELGIGSHEADPGKRWAAPRKPPEEPVDEQGRLGADGKGASCATKLPCTFRAQREQSAMRGGPKQLAGEIVSGRAREGSAPGAGSGTCDWYLWPRPEASKTRASGQEDP